MIKIGIIGGSGLDDAEFFQDPRDVACETPYGQPAPVLKTGTIDGVEVVLLSRHGKKHERSPTQVNYRANIHALKEQQVTHIIATTACGSLRQEIERGDFVIVDQFIDFTRHRLVTFHDTFENGAVHTSMDDPFDQEMRAILHQTAKDLNLRVHDGGTVVTIEGPRFSTRAESNMFRMWGADVINMSVAPEAILANEAQIPYAVVAMSTDYDCWKTDEKPVTWDEILDVFHQNVDNVKKLLVQTIQQMKENK